MVEHFLGKEEVIGSIPIVGSRFPLSGAWGLNGYGLCLLVVMIGRWTEDWVNTRLILYESYCSISVF